MADDDDVVEIDDDRLPESVFTDAGSDLGYGGKLGIFRRVRFALAFLTGPCFLLYTLANLMSTADILRGRSPR